MTGLHFSGVRRIARNLMYLFREATISVPRHDVRRLTEIGSLVFGKDLQDPRNRQETFEEFQARKRLEVPPPFSDLPFRYGMVPPTPKLDQAIRDSRAVLDSLSSDQTQRDIPFEP